MPTMLFKAIDYSNIQIISGISMYIEKGLLSCYALISKRNKISAREIIMEEIKRLLNAYG